VPAARVNTIDEAYEEPQVKAAGILQTVDHPKAGPVRVIATPVRLSETPASIRTPAPLLGENTDDVLGSLGFSASDVAELRSKQIIG
jgi:crotonobetainyl-CoA:carnitine CoA-transferase CaiB-like acyl-CoA transferase